MKDHNGVNGAKESKSFAVEPKVHKAKELGVLR